MRFVLTNHPELAPHYHGLIADIFKCDAELKKVIEVVAKNKIFYHVVDSDVTATKILAAMNQLNLPGSPTLVAMNRLQSNELPSGTPTASGVIQKLVFDNNYDSVIRYVFGKVLICRDLEHAVGMARNKKGVQCVTLDGDVAFSDGPISGGHIVSTSLRMVLYDNWSTSRDKILKMQAQVAEKLSESSNLLTEMEKLDIEFEEITKNLTEIANKVKQSKTHTTSLKRRMSVIKTRKDSKRARMELTDKNITKMLGDKEMFELELLQPMISPEDQVLADVLQTDIADMSLKHGEVKKRINEISMKNAQLAEFVLNNLSPRRMETSNKLAAHTENVQELKKLNEEKASLENEFQNLETAVASKEEEIEKIQTNLKKENADISKLSRDKKDLKLKIDENVQKIPQLLNETNKLEISLKTLQNHISNTGRENSVPDDPLYVELSKEQVPTLYFILFYILYVKNMNMDISYYYSIYVYILNFS